MNRINLIAIGVKDITKSLAFYKGLGFQTFEKENTPSIVFFNNEGTKLELFPLEGLVNDMKIPLPNAAVVGQFKGITLAYNAKSEQEVDAHLELAKSLGATIIKEAEHVAWGGYSGYFRDLDGIDWEVAYADIWKFDDQNMLIVE